MTPYYDITRGKLSKCYYPFINKIKNLSIILVTFTIDKIYGYVNLDILDSNIQMILMHLTQP